MSDPVGETNRRMKILDELTGFVLTNKLDMECMRYGGSMTFAQYFAISETSDIDLDIFISFSRITDVTPLLKFINAERLFVDSEDWSNLDLISSNGDYHGVDINLWLCNVDTFEAISRLENDYINYFSMHEPSSQKEYNVFGGGKCTLDKKVSGLRDGFVSHRQMLHEGLLLSENFVLNNMFFASPLVGAEYSRVIVDNMWDAFFAIYPRATKAQIMDFLLDNVKERFSPEFQERLEAELTVRFSHQN